MLKNYIALAGLLVSSLSTAIMLPWSQPVNALPAVDSACYMIGGPGQTLDLSALCGQGSTAAPQAPAPVGTSSPSFEQAMDNIGLRRWTDGQFDNIAFDVWTKQGGGFYYFLWSMPAPEDRSDPDVVVFFDSSVSRLNRAFVLGCYFSSGSTCTGDGLSPAGYTESAVEHLIDDLSIISPHVRRRGPCNVNCISGFR